MAAQDPRTVGARVSDLLAELGAGSDPRVAARAEELARLLVELYGTALERVTAALHEAGAPGDEVLRALAADELVSSLLILHGLHPQDVTERVGQALAAVRPYLGSHAGDVELLGVDPDGVVRLRLAGSCSGCPSSTVTVRMAIERAITEAAPDVTAVEVEGMVPEPAGQGLLQIGRRPPETHPFADAACPVPAGAGSGR